MKMFSVANGIVVLCLLAIVQREKINQFYVPYDPEKLSLESVPSWLMLYVVDRKGVHI